MTATTTFVETDEHLRTWDQLRRDGEDMVHMLDIVRRDAEAFTAALVSAYAANAEMIAEPEVEALDLIMLTRLLDHLRHTTEIFTGDVAKVTGLVDGLK